MTADELKQLRELYASATPGKWQPGKNRSYIVYAPKKLDNSYSTIHVAVCGESMRSSELCVEDARLIAALHNAAPDLFAAVEEAERLKAENVELRERLSKLCDRVNEFARELGSYQATDHTSDRISDAIDGVVFAIAEQRNKAESERGQLAVENAELYRVIVRDHAIMAGQSREGDGHCHCIHCETARAAGGKRE